MMTDRTKQFPVEPDMRDTLDLPDTMSLEQLLALKGAEDRDDCTGVVFDGLLVVLYLGRWIAVGFR